MEVNLRIHIYKLDKTYLARDIATNEILAAGNTTRGLTDGLKAQIDKQIAKAKLSPAHETPPPVIETA